MWYFFSFKKQLVAQEKLKASRGTSQQSLTQTNSNKMMFNKNSRTSGQTSNKSLAKSAANLYGGGGGANDNSSNREVPVDPVEEYLKIEAAKTNDNSSSSKQLGRFNTFNYRTMPGRIKGPPNSKLEKSVSGNLKLKH